MNGRVVRVLWVLLAMFLVVGGFGVTKARAMHGKKREMKKAILLVAFGTSIPEAQKVFGVIDQRVKKEFPGVEVRWGYTSKIIRKKLAGQGKKIDSPEVALAKLMDDGYTHVAVLSLHTIPGAEFHDLYSNAHLFEQMADGFQQVLVARPLLSSHEDMTRVVKALLSSVPKDRKPQDALVFMGHGSEHHPADAVYTAFNALLQKEDANAFLGTVEGYPTLDDILPALKAKGIKKAYLIPFMLVAGDHARNDMAGDEPDSWKSILKANGIEAVPVLKGTGENPQIVDVWVDHLKAAFGHFAEK